nr:DUF4157 domain-containing protein [Streptomyces sp. A012304]
MAALQRAAGNAAVMRALARQADQEKHTHGAGCGHDMPVQRSAVHDVLRSAGRPLDASVRGEMEARFGEDFSDVRLHTDSRARQSAKEVGALAYTSGSSIVLGDGAADKHTLAHELTHVVQQRRGPVSGTPTADGLSVSDPADRFEREAEANAHRVMAGPVPAARPDGPHRTGGGSPQSVEAGGHAPVQRMVTVSPEMYLRGIQADAASVSKEQLVMYLNTVVWDDLQQALSMLSDDETIADLQRRKKVLMGLFKSGSPDTQKILQEANGLFEALRKAQNNFDGLWANRDTRYATTPDAASGYSHTTRSNPVWGDEPGMRQQVAEGLGPGVHGNAYPEVPPRLQSHSKGGANLPVKQLTWQQARTLLPRPLINLLFDVRYQLEAPAGSGHVVDERTQDQKNRRVKSPDEPGTLRSWHQDDYGRIPDNQFQEGAIPPHAQSLHQHYTAHSQSGAGSSVQNAATGPRGLAEYTGTGTDGSHNVKVVLDYIQKRVYLTFTHYQYWALVAGANGGAPYSFWGSDSQKLEEAQGKLAHEHPQASAVMLSPWVEILMP